MSLHFYCRLNRHIVSGIVHRTVFVLDFIHHCSLITLLFATFSFLAWNSMNVGHKISIFINFDGIWVFVNIDAFITWAKWFATRIDKIAWSSRHSRAWCSEFRASKFALNHLPLHNIQSNENMRSRPEVSEHIFIYFIEWIINTHKLSHKKFTRNGL